MGFIDSSLERLEKKIVEENRKLLAETVRHEVRYGVSKEFNSQKFKKLINV
jgi:hypothetical protein